jgi:hypothetical protein
MDKPKSASAGDAENFILTYRHDHDPSTSETSQAIDQLQGLGARVVLPGVIRIVGNAKRIEEATKILTSKDWRLSQEKTLSSRPPHKSFLK